jgi:hypothetical protein
MNKKRQASHDDPAPPRNRIAGSAIPNAIPVTVTAAAETWGKGTEPPPRCAVTSIAEHEE